MAVNPPFANLVIQETQEDSFQAGATILQYQRVKLTAAGTVIPTSANTDYAIGTARSNAASGEMLVIRLDLPQQYGRSNTLINVGDPVYNGAAGLVTATAGGAFLGVAKIGTPVPGAPTGSKQASVIYCGVRVAAAA